MPNKTHDIHATTGHRDVLIKQKGDLLQLVFASEPDAIQSAIHRHNPEQLVMKNLQYLMGILLFMPPPQRILLLGVGAGSLVQFFRFYLPDSHITGVDSDRQLLEIAHDQMMLPRASDRLDYVIQDARQFISDCKQQYDLIVVDVFNGSQSPQWLLNDEFTRQLQTCLTPQGAVAYNLLINSESAFSTFYKNLRQSFAGQTLCLEAEEYQNLLVYALNFVAPKRSMMQNIERCQQAYRQYPLPFSQILSAIYDINPVDSGII